MKRIYSLLFSFIVLLAASIAAVTQSASPSPTPAPSPAPTAVEGARTVIKSDRGIAPVIPAMIEPILTGALLDGQLVTGKPVSATLESETVQTLPDGTTETRRTLTKIYRDANGRTRREQILYPNGETPSPTDTAKTFTIFDPVAKWSYSITPARQTALRHKLPAVLPTNPLLTNQAPLVTKIFRNENTGNSQTSAYTLSAPIVQSLGKQTILGVQADGYKVTFKIPAGALGNTDETETVYETWLSADLQMLLKCTITSPLSGTHQTLVKSLSRNAPASSLFAVPTGYVTKEMGVAQPNATPPPVQQ